MDLGLGNLSTVKAYCQQSAVQADTDADALLAVIAKGAAKALQDFCNRDFARLAGAIDEFTADRSFWVVRRAPVESITTIAVSDSYASGFVALTVNDALVNLGLKPGLLEFGSVLGTHEQRVRVTYTGGYFYETLEPTDGSYPTAVPSGSTAVPDQLRLAWLMQCNTWFSRRDSLNLIGTAGNAEQLGARLGAIGSRGLMDEVKEMVGPFRRYV